MGVKHYTSTQHRQIVRRIRELFGTHNYTQIAATMNKVGFRTSEGKPLTPLILARFGRDAGLRRRKLFSRANPPPATPQVQVAAKVEPAAAAPLVTHEVQLAIAQDLKLVGSFSSVVQFIAKMDIPREEKGQLISTLI